MARPDNPASARVTSRRSYTFRAVTIVLLSVVLGISTACHTPTQHRQDAAEWYARNASSVRWVGYQGSDQVSHHFIARVMDEWSFIKIPRNELTMADERPYAARPSGALYYYLVDPGHDYQKKDQPVGNNTDHIVR